MIDYGAARLNMVEGQLRTNEVTDTALLEAFLATPRERFVPEALRGAAYVDDDLPLGGGRHLLEPLVLARLVQLAEMGPRDRREAAVAPENALCYKARLHRPRRTAHGSREFRL